MSLVPQDVKLIHLKEPELMFGHGQTSDHPKDGLFLYGPHSAPKSGTEISVGVIGTEDGLRYFRRWAIGAGGYIAVPPPGPQDKEHRLHLSNFPGLQEAYGISYNPGNFVERTIDLKTLDESTRTANQHEAVRKAVDGYVSEIEFHDRNEERVVDIWVLVLPELVFERCKPLARRTGLPLVKGEFPKTQKDRFDAPLLAQILDQSAEQIFDDVPDFHRQVKARLLKYGHTSQLLRETTIAPNEFLNSAGYPIRNLQDPATVAWNVSTGLYYKTQPNPPWRLANVRPGVCYLGLVFKLIPNHPREHACCAAQMFLNEGDGVVFRGANGPWKTSDHEFHLNPSAAENLVEQVIETFRDKHGGAPEELFIHGRSGFTVEEWDSFERAVPKQTKLVGVRIRTTGGENKLYRDGDYPVLRGSALILNDRNAFLWSSGFVPRLDTYIGPETPNPLFVTVMRSTGGFPRLETVLEDILGLTKINYNACHYNDGLPVTIRFADRVGDVLVMGSAKDHERQPLKYYI